MDNEQKANVWLKKAQAHKIDVDAGLINPDVLREVRANMCTEDGFYPGLEAAIDEHDIEPDEDEHDMLELEMKKQGLVNMAQPPQPGMKPNGKPDESPAASHRFPPRG